MATGEKPIKTYFMINIGIIVIIVVSAGYIYLNFFADNSEKDEEATNIEKEKTESVDVSQRVSKAAFTFALFLGVTLLVLLLINKLSRSKSSRFY